MPCSFSLNVENMNLKHVLSGSWFIRLVLISLIIFGASIFAVFKNMELIVHGQLYYYVLLFSPDWADPYRIYTWMLYICLGLPMALSSIALVSSFLKVEKAPEKKIVALRRVMPKQGVAKVESQQIVKEAPKRVENDIASVRGGITCLHCNKVFSRALVMLDFHDGKNQLVSVCPYCNHVLGNNSDSKCTNEEFYVATPEEKMIR